ncbi:MAG: carboxypeptidase-like regulatory domain-containing protein [Cyanobacteria bacterium P01_D01_bin.44]
MKQLWWLGILSGISLGIAIAGLRTMPAWGHGAIATYEHTVTVFSKFDNGDPIANAQVAVYSPTDTETPWQTGTTNDQGEFTFAPDESTPGNWEVVVRQAGHGKAVTIPIGGGTAPGDQGLSKVIAGGAAMWGFVGTALFFSRGKKA